MSHLFLHFLTTILSKYCVLVPPKFNFVLKTLLAGLPLLSARRILKQYVYLLTY